MQMTSTLVFMATCRGSRDREVAARLLFRPASYSFSVGGMYLILLCCPPSTFLYHPSPPKAQFYLYYAPAPSTLFEPPALTLHRAYYRSLPLFDLLAHPRKSDKAHRWARPKPIRLLYKH
jgi:hypothetical protein